MSWLNFIAAKIDMLAAPIIPYGGVLAVLTVLTVLGGGSFVWFLRHRRKSNKPHLNQKTEADMFTFSKNNYNYSPDSPPHSPPHTHNDIRGQKVPASIIKTLSKIPHHPLPLYPVADRHNVAPQPAAVPASVIDTENPADYGIAAESESPEINGGQMNQEKMPPPQPDFEPIPPIAPPITPPTAPTLFSKDPSMAPEHAPAPQFNDKPHIAAVPHPHLAPHLTPMGSKINPN